MNPSKFIIILIILAILEIHHTVESSKRKLSHKHKHKNPRRAIKSRSLRSFSREKHSCSPPGTMIELDLCHGKCVCDEKGRRGYCSIDTCPIFPRDYKPSMEPQINDEPRSKDGLQLGGPYKNIYITKYACKPNEVFKVNCNTCVCNNRGMRVACTEILCPNWEEHTRVNVKLTVDKNEIQKMIDSLGDLKNNFPELQNLTRRNRIH